MSIKDKFAKAAQAVKALPFRKRAKAQAEQDAAEAPHEPAWCAAGTGLQDEAEHMPGGAGGAAACRQPAHADPAAMKTFSSLVETVLAKGENGDFDQQSLPALASLFSEVTALAKLQMRAESLRDGQYLRAKEADLAARAAVDAQRSTRAEHVRARCAELAA